jgi:hypothetical protein
MIHISVKQNILILFERHANEAMTCYVLYNYMQLLPGITIVKIRCCLKELYEEKKLVRVGKRLEVMGGYCYLYRTPTQTKKYDLKTAMNELKQKGKVKNERVKEWLSEFNYYHFVLVYCIMLLLFFLLSMLLCNK